MDDGELTRITPTRGASKIISQKWLLKQKIYLYIITHLINHTLKIDNHEDNSIH